MSWNLGLTKLQAMLSELYSTSDHCQEIVMKAGVPPGRIKFEVASLDRWYSILVEADKHKMVQAIVAVAQEEYEAHKIELTEAEQRYFSELKEGDEGTAGATERSQSKPAGVLPCDAIGEFLGLASDIPQAREALARARKSIEYNCQQIKSMSEYKNTHDLLQLVEGNHRSLYDLLYDEHDELRPLEQQDWRRTTGNRLALQHSIARVVERVEPMSFRADADPWLKSLGKASDDLQAAYDRKESQKLDDAMYAIGDVVSREMSPINDHLIGAIDALHLSDLVKELKCVYEEVRTYRGGSIARELERFDSALADLGRMSDRLTARRKEHDAWQQLDTRLRNEQWQMLPVIDEARFKRVWERTLRETMLTLCTPLRTGGAQDLESRISRVDAALAGTPVSQDELADTFIECRGAATKCFFQVDLELKRLCDELTEAGRSMGAAWERLP